MSADKYRCIILGCGNTLRGDDGVGPRLCDWAEQHFASDPRVRVTARHQWTPELAEEIARAESVLFIDCAIGPTAGEVSLNEIQPASGAPEIATHHIGAPELLALARDLYGSKPQRAVLLTVTAGSIDLGEEFSPAVRAALPRARDLLDLTVHQLLR